MNKYKSQIVSSLLAQNLYDKLMNIKNDEYAVLCLMAHLKSDKYIQFFIDKIENGENDFNKLVLLTININQVN